MKKKKVCKFLVFSMLLLFVIVTGIVSADDVTQISVNTPATAVGTERKANVFQIVLGTTGKMNVNLKHENLFSTDVFWTVEVLADDMEKVLQTFNSTGTDYNLTGSSLGLAPGTYYIRVYARKDCGHKYSDKPYTVTAMFEPSTSWEVEYNPAAKSGNNSQGTAMKIQPGAYAYGTICDKDDVDFFEFTIKKAGYVTLTFVHPNIYKADYYWKVGLVNDKTDVIHEMDSKGTKKSLGSAMIGLSAGTYYVKISGSNYSSSENYQIKVNYKPSKTWEKEYTNTKRIDNNSMVRANGISRGKVYSGTISYEDDKDCFTFNIKSPRTVTVTFSHKYKAKRTKLWYVEIYNSKLKPVYFFYSKGIDKSLRKRIHLKKGKYFIMVSKGKKYNIMPYKLSVK